MSLMDALTDTKDDAVKRAIAWGHPAIAITDHGVAQSFPDAWSAGKDKLKVLLGTEAYYINDVDDRLTVRGPQDQDLDGAIVCFDLETTGLSRTEDVITEIGAVVLEKGQVKERFQTFVDPQRKLAPNIVQLTGITDDMLVGAPSQEEALRAFLAFVGGRPLAAHNAEFDIGFVRAGCERYGIAFTPTFLDTPPGPEPAAGAGQVQAGHRLPPPEPAGLQPPPGLRTTRPWWDICWSPSSRCSGTGG